MVDRRTLSTLAGCVAALLLSACGSGGTEQGDAASADGAAPLKIMTLGTFSQPPFALGEIPVAVEAAVARVNDEGGVGTAGRPLELLTCDDQNNPNGAAACAREAATEGVVAVIGSFTMFGDNVMDLLDQAGIPYLLPNVISTKEGESPLSFPVTSAAGKFSGMVAGLAREGCTSVVNIGADNGSTRYQYEAFQVPVAESLGLEVEAVYYPSTATDMAPTVAKALSGGAECIVLSSGAQQTASALTALSQTGVPLKIATSTNGLPDTVLATLDEEVTEDVKVYSFFRYPSTAEPAAVQVAEDMAEIDDARPVNDAALNAYAGVLVLREVLQDLDDITTETLVAALESAGPVDVGLFAPVDFSAPGIAPGDEQPRMSNGVMEVYVAEDGVYVPSGDEPVDLGAALAESGGGA